MRVCSRSCSNAIAKDYTERSVLCKFDEEWRPEGVHCIYERKDVVNHPEHYTGDIECIDAIETAVSGLNGPDAVLTGHIIRYVWRWSKKNGAEDLRKAEWYLKRLIQRVSKTEKEES